jgi:methionyl-tRNA formyltransferase
MISHLRIIFFGTPEFAVASLEKLIQNGANIVAVVTAPDKPAGRGMHLKSSPVKECAVKHKIPVLQPTNLKNAEFLTELKSLNADLQIVIAFRMLPEAVWNMPRLGTINLHASLLPDYRGAAPINWAIINGETITGVTTFKLKHEIDTGDIIDQEQISIEPDDDAGTMHDKLMCLGADVMLNTVSKLAAGNYETKPQQLVDNVKIAPKLFSEHCEINWNDEGIKVVNRIRGLSPYPGAFTRINGKILKIYKADFVQEKLHRYETGTILHQNEQLLFVCNDGFINIREVQLEGKKRMKTTDFIRGHKQLIP